MASTPDPRNGNMPSRTTSTSSTHPANTELGRASLAGTNPPPQASSSKPVTVAELQQRTRYVERIDDERYINEDPVFPTVSAAILVGVSEELMRKWRQRGEGPCYYQYGREGRVVYALSHLNQFKAANLVKPRKKDRN